MSYILDALKRAEAERERGQVPGLMTSTPTAAGAPGASGAPPFAAANSGIPAWLWAALGAMLALGCMAAWWWTSAEPERPAAPAVSGMSPDPTGSTLSASSTASAANTMQAAEARINPTPIPPTAPTPSLPPTAWADQRPATPVPQANPVLTTRPGGLGDQGQVGSHSSRASGQDADATRPKTPTAFTTAPTTAPATQPATASNQAAGQGPVPREALPPELQQALPPLTFGGAMYSDQAASRMLLINNQAFREGDAVSADLVLREIRLRSAVLVFRGQAFSVNY